MSRSRRVRASCRRLLVLGVLLFGSAAAKASDVTIEQAHTEINNGIVTLDADAYLEFSDDAIEALNSGIPLTFELDVRISSPRKFLWDPEVFATQRRYSIQRHALSDQFILTDLITDERRAHSSLAQAIEDLGRLRKVPIVEQDALPDHIARGFRIRMRLDIESLPAPMIPLAYITPSWHMSSGWHRWQVEP